MIKQLENKEKDVLGTTILNILHKFMQPILVALLISACILIISLKIDIASYKSDIKKLSDANIILNTELQQEKSNNRTLRDEINDQNDKIEKFRIDIEKKTEEYKKLINKSDKDRFKEMYEKNPELEVKSNECKDIKNSLNTIRKLGF